MKQKTMPMDEMDTMDSSMDEVTEGEMPMAKKMKKKGKKKKAAPSKDEPGYSKSKMAFWSKGKGLKGC